MQKNIFQKDAIIWFHLCKKYIFSNSNPHIAITAHMSLPWKELFCNYFSERCKYSSWAIPQVIKPCSTTSFTNMSLSQVQQITARAYKLTQLEEKNGKLQLHIGDHTKLSVLLREAEKTQELTTRVYFAELYTGNIIGLYGDLVPFKISYKYTFLEGFYDNDSTMEVHWDKKHLLTTNAYNQSISHCEVKYFVDMFQYMVVPPALRQVGNWKPSTDSMSKVLTMFENIMEEIAGTQYMYFDMDDVNVAKFVSNDDDNECDIDKHVELL